MATSRSRAQSRFGSPRLRRQLLTIPPDGLLPNRGINEAVDQLALDPTEWSSAYDVEPLVDAIRRRRGLDYASDSIGSSVASNATGSDDYFPLNSTTKYIAQKFTTGSAYVIEGITVELRIDATPLVAYPLQLWIAADDTGEPAATPETGFGPTAFNELNTDQLPVGAAAWTPFEFNMLDPTSLASGTYWFVIFLPNITGGYNIYAKADVDGAGTNAAYSEDNSTWDLDGGDDELIYDVRQAAGETEITKIHDFQTDDGTQRHLVIFTQTIYKNVAGTLSSVGQFDSAHDKDTIPGVCTVDNRVCFTNGDSSDPSKKLYFDGGTERYCNEGISAPTATAVATPQTSGGNLADGTYYIDWYYLDDTAPRNIRSNSRYGGDSSTSLTATISGGSGNGSIDLSSLPGAVARTNDRATKVRFYILGPGTNSKWLEAGVEIALATTTASITDTALFGAEAEFDHDLPPVHTIKLAASEYQFIAGIDGQPRRVQWSRKRGRDVDVESFPPFNRVDLGLLDDEVRALALVPPNIVLVGMRNSIWALDGSNPNRPETLIAQGVGVSGQDAITAIGQNAFFWSDAEKSKGPYQWNGQAVVPLIKPSVSVNGSDGSGGLNRSRNELIRCAHYAPDRTRYQWWSLVSESGESDHNLILVYDYALEAWTRYRISGNCLGEVETSGTDQLFIGTIQSRELLADSGNDDLGDIIAGTVTLAPLSFGDLHDRVRMRGLVLASKTTNLGPLLLRVVSDLGEGQEINLNLDQAGAAGSVLGTGVLGSFILAGAGLLYRKTNFRTSGRVLTATFSGSSPWEINRLAWLVQSSGRK